MDCTYVPCAKYGLELRCMHNGGSTLCTWQQAMHRLYVLVYTKHGQASGMQRRVTILTCRLNTEVRSKLMLKYALYGYRLSTSSARPIRHASL